MGSGRRYFYAELRIKPGLCACWVGILPSELPSAPNIIFLLESITDYTHKACTINDVEQMVRNPRSVRKTQVITETFRNFTVVKIQVEKNSESSHCVVHFHVSHRGT